MKYLSWNVNGIRSVARKNAFAWIAEASPDVLCLQELKAQAVELPDILPDYHVVVNAAHTKGYAGVALYSKTVPEKVVTQIGNVRFDSEGRYIEAYFRDRIVICLYMPHGGRTQENLPYKLEVYGLVLQRLRALRGEKVIVLGDVNIAHSELDLARSKENVKNIMFTPAERVQLDALEGQGYVDTFRYLHPEAKEYTWWPWLKTARERDIGWRIDYGFVSASLAGEVVSARILRGVSGSDHCPIEVVV